MKKLFALLLLPSIAFAGNIGKNYVGAGVGYISSNFEIASVDFDFDGFAYGLAANFNAIPLSSSYGADISISFAQGSGLEGNSNVTNAFGANVEIDSTSMVLALRPFTKLGGNIVFADIAYSYGKSELDVAGVKTADSDSALALGVGTEIDLNNITCTPSLTWIFNDNEAASNVDLSEAISLSLPFDYHYNEKLDVSFSYSHLFYDSFTFEGASIKPSGDAFSLGVKYKY
jgi:hypothetical protein